MPTYLEYGDRVAFAGVGMRFVKATAQDVQTADGGKKEPSAIPGLFVLTIFQLLGCLSLLLHYADKLPLALPVCFAGLLLMEWIYCGVRPVSGGGRGAAGLFPGDHRAVCGGERGARLPFTSNLPRCCWDWPCSAC